MLFYHKHLVFPLEKKEFDVDSSIDILHDGNISSCREIEFLGLVNSSSESVSYDVRLHDRAIIGLITIEFQNASGKLFIHQFVTLGLAISFESRR